MREVEKMFVESTTDWIKIAELAITFFGGVSITGVAGAVYRRHKERSEHRQSAEYLYERALKLDKRGKTKQAEALYDKAIERDPTLIDALEKSAGYKKSRADYPRIIEAYTRQINLKKDRVRAVDDTLKLIALYEKKAEADPDNPAWLTRLRECHLFLQEHKQAVDDYWHLAKCYAWRGGCRNELGKYEEAIEDGTVAIRLDPKYAIAYNNRGNAKAGLGQYEESIADLDEAIRLDPKDALVYYNRGNAKRKLGKNEDAIKDYDEAIRLDPKDAFGYNNRGNAKDDLGQHEDAIKDYDEAIRLNPKYANAYHNRAIAHEALGNTEQAAADRAKAAELEGSQGL